MPCRDDYPPSRQDILDQKVPAAVLCALIRRMSVKQCEELLTQTDWKRAGVTKAEFMEWWRLHQQRDEERERREAEQAKQEALRRSAMSKLSKEERAALGLDRKRRDTL